MLQDFGGREGSRPLTPFQLKKRIETLLDLWKAAGMEVGGLVIDGDRIAILTPEGAANEQDPFENWQKKRGAA